MTKRNRSSTAIGRGSDATPQNPRLAGAFAEGLILGRANRAVQKRPPGFVTPHASEVSPSDGNELVTYRGDGHVLTIAPSGTGKTSTAATNLLNHPGAAIVFDPKGTLFAVTSRRRREMGHKVYGLDMRDAPEVFDSLNHVDFAKYYSSEPAVSARVLGDVFIERGKGGENIYWDNGSQTVIGAGITHMLVDRPESDRRMSYIYDQLTRDDPIQTLAWRLDNNEIADPIARAGFISLLNLPERETRPCMLSSVQQHLRHFESKLVRRLTDTTTVDLEALVAGEAVTIYVIVGPDKIQTYAPLLKAWFSGLLMAMTCRKRLPLHRTLFIVDEIAALGPMDAFVTCSTLMRGWGVTLWSYWQSAGQIEATYGHQARTIVDNAGVIQLFGARNRRSAQEFSSIVGGIDADEIMAMGKHEQIVLVEGGQPIRAARTPYYCDPIVPLGSWDPDPLAPQSARL
jgi:type IV secretion system protein VirD4